MARLEVDGMEQFVLSMNEMAELPEEILDQMLLAEAAVVIRAQKSKGQAYGVHRTGMTLESIKAGKPRKTKDGKAITITPQGKNSDGNRNAEVAFVNEYGKKGQPARPFIRDANESSETEATAAAERIYENWLNSR